MGGPKHRDGTALNGAQSFGGLGVEWLLVSEEANNFSSRAS